MALGWRVFLFLLTFASFSIWFFAAYARYISRYRVAHRLSPQAEVELLVTGGLKLWQVLTERQSDPKLERLRKRVLLPFALGQVLMFGMFAFLVFGGPG